MFSVGCRLLSNFSNCRRGNIALLTAMAMLPLSITAGGGVDYFRASNLQSALQRSLDAAVLAGAKHSTSTDRDMIAGRIFAANIASSIPGTTATFALADGVYTGTASASVATAFLKLINIPSMHVSATAAARVNGGSTSGGATTSGGSSSGGGSSLCIYALSTTMGPALEMGGGSRLEMDPGSCFVQVNSPRVYAANLGGGSVIVSGENCIVGPANVAPDSTMSPPRKPICTTAPDPFAGTMTYPTVGPCDHHFYQAPTSRTLYPGVYCGGLNVSNSTITLMPGLYIIKDGLLNVSGSTMTGTGVSFFITGNSAGFNNGGGARWKTKAMSTGPLAGFAFVVDPRSQFALPTVVLGGGSTIDFEGILYFPRQMVDLGGGSSLATPAPFTSIIANNFVLGGASRIRLRGDWTATDLPIPAALKKGGPSTVLLIK
jgi:Flp pilus assembly protein TadG